MGVETRRLNPVQLVRLAIAGSALAASVWFLGLIHVPIFPHGCGFWAAVWGYRLRMVVFLLPGAVGLTLMFWAEKRFKRGFMDDLWTEAELEAARRLLTSGLWKAVAISFSVLILVSLLFVLGRNGSKAAWSWYVLMLPSQTVQRLRTLITPRAAVSSGLRDWRSLRPIQSEHWGERGV